MENLQNIELYNAVIFLANAVVFCLLFTCMAASPPLTRWMAFSFCDFIDLLREPVGQWHFLDVRGFCGNVYGWFNCLFCILVCFNFK